MNFFLKLENIYLRKFLFFKKRKKEKAREKWQCPTEKFSKDFFW